MNTPNPLCRGDKVAIVATARKVSPVELEPAVQLLRSWGLCPVIPDGLYATECQFAGSDAHRAALLQHAIDDVDVKAIICARGGYGTARIIDSVDFSPLAVTPKWIVGYSDATVLHSHVHTHVGCPTLHAIMPINITADDFASPAVMTLHDVLFGVGECDYRFDCAPADNAVVRNRCGNAEGVVVGGNLSILYSLVGTPSDIDTSGKLLLIEDVDEYLYHIDRMMQALRRSGKFDKLKGLIVGQFTDMHDNATPFGRSVVDIVLEAVAGYDFPVCFNAPFGHVGVQNLAIPLGRVAHLEVSPTTAQLSF